MKYNAIYITPIWKNKQKTIICEFCTFLWGGGGLSVDEAFDVSKLLR